MSDGIFEHGTTGGFMWRGVGGPRYCMHGRREDVACSKCDVLMVMIALADALESCDWSEHHEDKQREFADLVQNVRELSRS